MKDTIIRKNLFVVLIVFMILGFLSYARFLNNPFIMDDEVQILQNKHIQDFNEFSSLFTSSTMDSGGSSKMGGIYYKPLMTAYYSVVWNFVGAEPLAYRLPLLIFHILSAFIIFLFSLNFLSQTYSLLLGMLFLLHPVNSEVVFYIADAQDVFYFFFGILGLYLISVLQNNKILFLCLIAVFTLGLLSKETGALFLAMGCAYAFLLQRKKIVIVFTAAIFVGFSYLVLRWQIGLTKIDSPVLLFHRASFFERLRMIPLILSHYIEIYFIPARLSITTDFVLREFSWNMFWLPLFFLISFLTIFIKLSKRILNSRYKKITQFFLLAIVFWFLLHGQIIVPLDGVYCDRWFYIAVWSFSSLFFLFLQERFQEKNDIRKMVVFFCIVFISFFTRIYLRGLDWQEPLKFYTREAELHPFDSVMANNVGVELFRLNNIEESEPYFIRATQFNPLWDVGWNNLGAVREQQQNYAEALNMYEKSVSLGTYSLAYENYARLLIKIGQKEKAYNFLKDRALLIFPNNAVLKQLWNFNLQHQ